MPLNRLAQVATSIECIEQMQHDSYATLVCGGVVAVSFECIEQMQLCHASQPGDGACNNGF